MGFQTLELSGFCVAEILTTRLNAVARKRRAVQAARDRDGTTLWNLTEANLTRTGRDRANVRPHTLKTYEVGVKQVLEAATA